MTSDEIKISLAASAEDFARWLFPAGRKDGNQWRVGSLRGEAGESLAVCMSGAKAGMFKDFNIADDHGANLIELFRQARGVSFAHALRACAEWLMVPLTASSCSPSLPAKSPSMRYEVDSAAAPSVMPDSVAAAWNEGVDFLLGRPSIADCLASFRGWPAEFARYFIECAAVSMPRHGKERGWAFQVVTPEGERGAMTTRPIGYHVRLDSNEQRPKVSWRYQPFDLTHGHGIPALPYILGEFEHANLLVITEGQWDALTFALAAGWLGEGCLWPAGVGLIGVRGVQGIEPFLRYYRRFWPKHVDCLLLADNDASGSSWYGRDDCFAAKLSELCRKVKVVDCAPHKDFNDLFRREKVGPAEIETLLASHGIAIESGVAA